MPVEGAESKDDEDVVCFQGDVSTNASLVDAEDDVGEDSYVVWAAWQRGLVVALNSLVKRVEFQNPKLMQTSPLNQPTKQLTNN